MIERLTKLRDNIQKYPLEDYEYCMCGDKMLAHSPYSSNHSPVSQGDYARRLLIEEIDGIINDLLPPRC